MHRLLDTRTYDPSDQQAFAELSGDFNPLHLDRQAARREFFGDIVVHGVHGLMRALDAWCAGRTQPLRLTQLKASFPTAVYLDVPVQAFETELGDGWARLEAGGAGGPSSLQARLAWEPAPRQGADGSPGPLPPESARVPEAPQFDELPGRSGELPVWLDRAATLARFPHVSALLPPLQIAQLLAVTRLVGMHCPGLRSVLLGMQLDFSAPGAEGAARLAYRVERALRGASLVQLRLSGAGVSGSVDTLYRPPPQAQPSLATVRERVREGEFAEQVALVVGGSRGLGEVTAKLIASGGGRVAVTYQRGRTDAEQVAAAIRAGGQRCDVLHCDTEGASGLERSLRELDFVPTHLYYFASPKIFVKRGGEFDPALFARFRAAYVDGFEALCRVCLDAGARSLRAFYPSSTALEENVKNLEEYIAAKRAGEERCAELVRSVPGLEIVLRRLPRIATDQTTTFVRHAAADALDVMADLVREMDGPGGTQA